MHPGDSRLRCPADLSALEPAFPGTALIRTLILKLILKFAEPTRLRAAGRGMCFPGPGATPGKTLPKSSTSSSKLSTNRTSTVIGTDTMEFVIPRCAPSWSGQLTIRTVPPLQPKNSRIVGPRRRRDGATLDDFLHSTVLMSVPAVCIKTAVTIFLSIGEAGPFTAAGRPGRLCRHRTLDTTFGQPDPSIPWGCPPTFPLAGCSSETGDRPLLNQCIFKTELTGRKIPRA